MSRYFLSFYKAKGCASSHQMNSNNHPVMLFKAIDTVDIKTVAKRVGRMNMG